MISAVFTWFLITGLIIFKELKVKRFLQVLVKGKNFQFRNGESFNHVADRMMESIKDIEFRYPHEPVLIVTHGMAMRCLMARKHGWSVWKLILKQVQNMEAWEFKV